MVITQALFTHAINRPTRTAVLDGEKSWTWRQFADRVCKLAGALEQAGVNKGDRIALLMLNDSRYLELYYGITLLGAVVVPLNVRLTTQELLFMLRDSGPRMLFLHREFLPALPALRAEAPHIEKYVLCEEEPHEDTVGYEELLACADPVTSAAQVREDDLAAIFYTGGTTGLPKGVMLSHRNLVANAYNVAVAMQYHPGDVYLHAAPMFHMADGASTFAVTLAGGTHAHIRAFEPNRVLEAIQRHRVTATLLVPTMINTLIHTPTIAQYDLSSWQKVLYGGSPCPVEVLRKAKQLLSIRFYQAYGQSEAAPVLTFLLPEDHVTDGDERQTARLASCGQPVPGVELRCVNERGEDVRLGEVGEIIARGPNVMMGYWNRPQETAEAVRDGWLHTGDMATVDEENFYYIVDRKKDMIITGGENVYSVEVENVLYSHPAVLEAAVVGVPDEKWGEAVKAVVVLRPNHQAGEAELVAHCRRFLAGYKVPKSVDFVEELPKSGAGKILKRTLRDRYWEGYQRRVN